MLAMEEDLRHNNSHHVDDFDEEVEEVVKPVATKKTQKTETGSEPEEATQTTREQEASTQFDEASLVPLTPQQTQSQEKPTEMFVGGTPSNNNIALIKEQLKYCANILLRGLKRHKDAAPFLQPVDPVALGIPDYPKVVTHPMDLSTIQKKLDQSLYAKAEDFIADVRLMLSNCFAFNTPDSQVYKMGKNLEKYFDNSLQRLPKDLPTPGSSTSNAARRTSVVAPGAARPRRDTVSSPRRPSATSPSSSVSSTGSGAKKFGEMTFCRGILAELCKKTHQSINWPFMTPVDPVALGIPDYFDVIKHPMDLGTIRKKLDLRQYNTAEQFESDVRLIFSNCYAYNAPDSDIVRMAKQLEEVFESKWATRHLQQSGGRPSTSTARSGAAHPSALSTSYATADNDEDRILQISRQIQILQNELNDLLMRKKTGGARKKSAPSAPISSHPQSSAVASKPHKPTFEDLCKIDLTFEEKRDLSEAVNNMPADKLLHVVEIIREGMPSLEGGNGDLIELDIESLDIRTLRKLQAYIKECKVSVPKKRKSSSGAGTLASQSNTKQQKMIDKTPTSLKPTSNINSSSNTALEGNAQPFPAESESEEEEPDEDQGNDHNNGEDEENLDVTEEID